MATKDGSSFGLTALLAATLANLLSLEFMALILVWALHFQGGLAFNSENARQTFSMHVVLMVIGPLCIVGEAIMVYKTVNSTRKVQKLVNLILHLMALVIGLVGIAAIFKSEHEVPLANFRTLHSWLGITTISLYGLQWLSAAISFCFPRAATPELLSWHCFAEMVIFLMTVVTAETGLIRLRVPQGTLNAEALILKFTGVLILLFAIAVSLSVILPRTR